MVSHYCIMLNYILCILINHFWLFLFLGDDWYTETYKTDAENDNGKKRKREYLDQKLNAIVAPVYQSSLEQYINSSRDDAYAVQHDLNYYNTIAPINSGNKNITYFLYL